jgi:hypothetical protein
MMPPEPLSDKRKTGKLFLRNILLDPGNFWNDIYAEDVDNSFHEAED